MSANIIRIMPLGDSITVGLGSSSSAGYRLRLWQDGKAAHWQFTFVGTQSSGPVGLPEKQHEGHLGWRIDQISAHIVPWLHTYQPNIILLQIGSNDIIQNYSPQMVIQRLAHLLEQITTTLPHTIVIVAQVTPLRNPLLNMQVVTYNHAIPGLIEGLAARGRHVAYVDMYHAVPVSTLVDGIHPNTRGYTMMAAVWYSALRKEIAKTASTIKPVLKPKQNNRTILVVSFHVKKLAFSATHVHTTKSVSEILKTSSRRTQTGGISLFTGREEDEQKQTPYFDY